MIITLSVVMCLQGQCMTKAITDSQRQPDMTIMGCLTQGPPSIAKYISDNYPGATIKKWQCQFGNMPPARPDM